MPEIARVDLSLCETLPRWVVIALENAIVLKCGSVLLLCDIESKSFDKMKVWCSRSFLH